VLSDARKRQYSETTPVARFCLGVLQRPILTAWFAGDTEDQTSLPPSFMSATFKGCYVDGMSWEA
jgi:hypothetical protein